MESAWIYSGTSRPRPLSVTLPLSENAARLYENGLLSKRTSKHWYDPEVERFLPDRLVYGTCPKCGDPKAYSDVCDACGHEYDPSALLEPKSTVSSATPELRDSDHLWLDMWAVSDLMKSWVETKKKTWRPVVIQQVLDDLSHPFESKGPRGRVQGSESDVG